MTHKVTISQASGHFTEYLNQVIASGERFVLIEAGEEVAELAPVHSTKNLGELPALLRSLPHLTLVQADDFANDLADHVLKDEPLSPNGPWE